jgi:hypothetical protein
MNLEIGTVARNSQKRNTCFEFSVLVLCSVQCPNFLDTLLYVIRNALARVDQGLEEGAGSPRRWTPGQLIGNLVNAFMSMVNTARSNIRRWNET